MPTYYHSTLENNIKNILEKGLNPAFAGSGKAESFGDRMGKAAAFGQLMGKMAASSYSVVNPRTILISGHSGSGKSTTANDLAKALNLPVLSIDDHPEFKPLFVKDKEDRHLIPGSPERKRYLNSIKNMSKETLESAQDGAIVEGTQLASLGKKYLSQYPNRILVSTDLPELLKQRLERIKRKSIAKGKPWNDDIEAKRYEKGMQIYNSNKSLINRYGIVPGTLTHNTRDPESYNRLLKALEALKGR